MSERNGGCGTGCSGCQTGCAVGNHNYTHLEDVKPTCYTLGYGRYVCTDCGKVERRNYTAQLEHVWQGFVTRDPTCEYEGRQVEVCLNCRRMRETSLPKHSHSWSTRNAAATCTSPGYRVQECGDSYKDGYTDAAGHQESDWIIDKAPTYDGKWD